MKWIALVFLWLLTMALIGWLGTYLEKKDYNGGVCPRCGNKLKHFDTDSQGGRGYKCVTCQHYAWVSWPWVDRNYNFES